MSDSAVLPSDSAVLPSDSAVLPSNGCEEWQPLESS